MALRPAVGPAILGACVAVLVAACDLLPATGPTDLTAVITGCGVGISPDVCFTQQ